MPDFGGGEFKTTDGLDVAGERPYGAMVVVHRGADSGQQVLILHRNGQPEAGDWSWTPPSGARFPGEEPIMCAQRELHEETGFDADVTPFLVEGVDWALYAARVGPDDEPRLDGEHDRYDWVSWGEAVARCLPTVVSDGLSSVLAAMTMQD